MARISLELLGANPIPLDWAETYEGLKSGVVDGMENFPSAAPKGACWFEPSSGHQISMT